MRMLDLFCGEGLAAWGYWRSGRFHEIVGVDLNPKMSTRYSFDFVLGDALKLPYDFMWDFDFIHASPPCQAYSKITPDRSIHPRLVAATHLILFSVGKPYVIENVEGSGAELRPNVVIDGHSMGLSIQRRRYFHLSTLTSTERLISSAKSVAIHGNQLSRDRLIDLFGLRDYVSENRLSRLTVDGIEQGIPPCFTEWIARRVFPAKAMII